MHELRMSDIRQFLSCRRQFYLQYVLGYTPVYSERDMEMGKADLGTLVHAGLESHYNGEHYAAGVHHASELMRTGREFGEGEWEMTNAKHLAHAELMISRYLQAKDHEDDLLFETEVEIKTPFEDFILVGHMDLLKYDPATEALHIVDFKTTANVRQDPPRPGDFQLLFYAWLIWRERLVVPYSAGHVKIKRGMTSRTKPPYVDYQAIPIDEPMLDQFEDRLMRILSEIRYQLLADEQNDKWAHPNMGMHCKMCRVKDLCDGMDDGSDWMYTASVEFKRKEKDV